eukprot:jgi/Tetstr1/431235/TSEL_002054.t1
MAAAALKHQMYEHMYPDHASPVSLSEISAAIEETLRDLRVATPQKALRSWSTKEVSRWTAALPVKGLAAVAAEVLADVDGTELSALSEEDLQAAGMKSKVHRAQLVRARDAVLKRDAHSSDEGASSDEAAFAEAVGLLTGTMKGDASAQQAEAFEMLAAAAEAGGRPGEAALLLCKAIEIREAVEGEDSPAVAAALEKLASVLEGAGKVDEAEVALWRALKVCEAADGAKSEATARTLEALIVLLDKQGREVEASKLGERLENARTVSALEGATRYLTADNMRRAVVYTLAALLLLQLVAPEVVEPMAAALPGSWRFQWQFQTSRARLKLWETVHGAGQPGTLPHVQGLAMLLERHAQWGAAAEQWSAVLDIAKAHMDPADPLAATALAKLGSLALRRGAVKDAEALLVKAIRIWATTPLVYEATDLAAAQSLLAEVLMKAGRYREAEPLYRQAQRMQAKYEENIDDAVIARTLAGLGHVLAATGKHEEAQELTARALALAEGLAEGQLTAELLERVLDAAEVMQSMGDFVQAGTLFRRGADVAMKTLGVYHEKVAHALSSLASCLAQLQGKSSDADAVSLRSVEVAALGSGGANTLTAAKYMARRGGLLAAAKRHDEAKDLLQAAQRFVETNPGAAKGLEMATILTNLGGVLLAQGKKTEAADNMARALEIRKHVEGEYHPNVGNAAANLAIVHSALGMEPMVEQYLGEAAAAWTASFGEEESQSRMGLALARVKSHREEAGSSVPLAA